MHDLGLCPFWNMENDVEVMVCVVIENWFKTRDDSSSTDHEDLIGRNFSLWHATCKGHETMEKNYMYRKCEQ